MVMEVRRIPFDDGRRNYRVADVKVDRLVKIINKIIGEHGIDTAVLSQGTMLVPPGNYFKLPIDFFLNNPELKGVEIAEYKLITRPEIRTIEKICLYGYPDAISGKPSLIGRIYGYNPDAIPVMEDIAQAVSALYRPSPIYARIFRRD